MADVPQALHLALELARTPALAQAMRRRPLPHDVLLLIRIAGGCEETCRSAASAVRQPPERIKHAVAFYLQQVLLFPGSDSYRVLGALPDTSQEILHEHMRWMMRWLHPDRTRDEWGSAFTQRVLDAWDDVKSPARRARYDRAERADRNSGAASLRGGKRKRRHGQHGARGLPWIARPIIRAPASMRSVWAGIVAGLAILLGLALWLMPAA